MAKTYIDTVKYLVYSSYEIDGMVEKPDVVGALFGQTEGLLGDELDLRELQKNGRIGRIEVELQIRGGKSIGRILLPSSLDMVETSILAAALETVDRVGPCEARISVDKIEDTRNLKRRAVVDRAKALLKALVMHELPESREITELVREEVKVSEVSEFGPDRLPAGPAVASSDAIIIVEGRADVVNLLKNGIGNVIAIGGATVPRSAVDICREKEVTVFLDGDRGGDIILRELSAVAEIDYVARAPPGREVEELTRKEIIKCIRSRVPFEQVEQRGYRQQRAEPIAARPRLPYAPLQQPQLAPRPFAEVPSQQHAPPSLAETMPQPAAQQAVPQSLIAGLLELEGTLRARAYDSSLNIKNEVPVRDLIRIINESEGLHAIVLDGIITQRLIDIAESKGTKLLVGLKMGGITRKPEGMLLYAKEGAGY